MVENTTAEGLNVEDMVSCELSAENITCSY